MEQCQLAVDDALLQRLGIAPVDTSGSGGAVGTVEQLQDAAGNQRTVPAPPASPTAPARTPSAPASAIPPAGSTAPPAPGPSDGSTGAAPAKPATGTPPSVNLSGGLDLLPRISYAVEGVESNHQQIDSRTGRTLTNETGVLGLMQVMPDRKGGTTKGKYDLTDPVQNKEAGNEELVANYKKYGNWTDALIAYNWGPGGPGNPRTDAWIAAGRDWRKLPKETQKYVPAVLGQLGMSPGSEFTEARDTGDAKDDLLRRVQEARSGTQERDKQTQDQADDALTASLMGMGQAPVDMSKEAGEESASLTAGAVQGFANVGLGPVQTALQYTAPELHKELTDAVNKITAPFEDAIAAHPYAHFAGETIGTTVGILAASRLLRPITGPLMMTQTMTVAARNLPTVLKAMGGGFGYGFTSFNKDPDSANRLAQGILGMGIGWLGSEVAQTVGAVLKEASNRQFLTDSIDLIKKNVGALEPSLSQIKEAVVGRYKMLTDFRDRLYTMRNQAGQVMQGYPSGLMVQGGKAEFTGLSKVLDDAQKGRIGFDETSGLVKGTATQLKRDLGLKEQEDALALWEAQQKDFEQAMEKFMKGPDGKTLRLFGSAYLDVLERRGVQVPEAPQPFVAQPIEASRMAEARRTVNRAIGKAKDGSALKTQLNILKQSVVETASRTAKEAGVSVETYERRQALADKFNKDKIVPIKDSFKGKSVKELAEDTTHAEFYDRVINAVKSHDVEKQEALYTVLGKKGREEARKAVMNHILSQSMEGQGRTVNPKKIGDFITQNEIGLRTLMGREEFTNLKGLAKVAEAFAMEGKKQGFMAMIARHNWMVPISIMEATRGEFTGALSLMGSAVALEVLRASMRGIQAVPRIVGPLLPRAARAGADSPEMTRIVQSIDNAMRTLTRTQTRVLPQESGGQPVTPGVEMGQEIAGTGASMFFRESTPY